MKLKWIGISLACCAALSAAETSLGTIEVEEKIDTQVVKNVSGEEIKSADLGEALAKESASVNIIRRSGISNDVVIRGQKKDNIVVTVDGAKICGACPNRMDPPISHILSNNVDYVEINEGPFDVTEFGNLSAGVKVHTLKPTQETHGEIALNAGSWDYQKGSFLLSGGVDKVRFLLSGSAEQGDQYEDGDGNDFVGQIDRAISDGDAMIGNQYQDKYRDKEAFTKKTLMGKMYWDITDDQELRLGYTINRSDSVLYPNTPMDAVYDDSDIFNLGYTAKNLGEYSKKLELELYRSTVDHPMSTEFRNAGAANYTTAHLETEMEGAKLTNSFDIDNHDITVGIDANNRNWDGYKYSTKVSDGSITPMGKMIDDVDTKNRAVFVKDKIKINENVSLEAGVRYDDTTIDKANIKQRDFNDLSGYMFATYKADNELKYFGGIGRSTRVPDAKELYLMGSGTATLDAVTNHEIDLGIEKKFDNATLKAKVFYSDLSDYIAYNATSKHYENVDAALYGIDVSGSYFVTEDFSIDGSMAFQIGEKDHPLTGQNDTDLPDVPPFKANIGATYAYDDTLKIEGDIIAAAPWSRYDFDNGEHRLDGYIVFDLKATKDLGSGLELSIGVDNLFDSTYAVSNSYKDLTLLTGTDPDVMVLNEPGRYFYAQLKYKF
ncbi:MAG: TonB-dependent receptor [Sulfurovaceae bacterium]|nr:TonB-dependent receptor [Sulfurovaceae bacterium]